MERPRTHKVASKISVVALAAGLLVAGYGGSSQAGHRCDVEPTPSRFPDVREGAEGVYVEQGGSRGRPYVGVFAPGSFVVADGDETGAEVYGATDATDPVFGSRQWFWVRASDDGDLKACGAPS